MNEQSSNKRETMSSLQFNEENGRTRDLSGRILNVRVVVSATMDPNSELRPIVMCIGLTAVLLFLIGLIYSSVEQCWQSIAQPSSIRPQRVFPYFLVDVPCILVRHPPPSLSNRPSSLSSMSSPSAYIHHSASQRLPNNETIV